MIQSMEALGMTVMVLVLMMMVLLLVLLLIMITIMTIIIRNDFLLGTVVYRSRRVVDLNQWGLSSPMQK